jgi:hypothetical protein
VDDGEYAASWGRGLAAEREDEQRPGADEVFSTS